MVQHGIHPDELLSLVQFIAPHVCITLGLPNPVENTLCEKRGC